MQLRRFTAESTPAALGAVRLALGDDAIILANRKIGDQVEIIATGHMDDAQSLANISLDDNSIAQNRETALKLSQEGRANLLSAANQVNQIDDAPTVPDDVSTPTTRQALSPQARRAEVQAAPEPVAHKFERIEPANNTKPQQALLEKSDVRPPNDPQSATPETSEQEVIVDNLRTDLASLADTLQESIAKQSAQLAAIVEQQNSRINNHFKGLEINLWGSNSPNKRMHLQRLFSLGIGAELAVQLVERSDPQCSVDDAMRHSFTLLKSTLPIGSDKTFSAPGVTVLSGPPGAGKTTVLMKMAIQHVKEHGSDSIVLICADTRRIGAFEELQAYGRLIGVPTVHAHDTSELDSLLGAFTHKKMVLIDHTLPMDKDAIGLPARILQPESTDAVRRLFVLSASTQGTAVDALVNTHCRKQSIQCVLTHLDANARLGELFSPIIRHHLPVAYWSDSASIQKPLQKAEASMLIATAAAMSRRLPVTTDDEWLLRLIQPSEKDTKKAPVRRTVDRELA